MAGRGSRLKTAGAAEIIRAHQKDEYYASYLKAAVSDLFQSICGARWWIQWRKELDVLAELGYFTLTTVAGLQTLGEEYVNIVQVDNTRRAIPSTLRRGFLVALHVGAPYLLDKLLQFLEKQAKSREVKLREEVRASLLRLIPVARQVVMILHRCHLALFYMKEVFYHIAKRAAGIHYLLVRSGSTSSEGRPSFKILGYLCIAQLSYTLVKELYNLWSTMQHYDTTRTLQENTRKPSDSLGSTDEPVSTEMKCSLCLEARRDATATPCGHLYCYTCITEWCNTKAECPLCREPFPMSRLIHLQNFDPT